MPVPKTNKIITFFFLKKSTHTATKTLYSHINKYKKNKNKDLHKLSKNQGVFGVLLSLKSSFYILNINPTS